jgi:hypothetical protein
VLRVYGRAPLCYYLAHMYLYGLAGAVFFRHAVPMAWTYAVWIAGLVPLYFICVRFSRFKAGKPADSLWRLF